MILLFLVAAAVAAGPSGLVERAKPNPARSAFVQPKCAKTTSYKAVERGKPVKPQKLNELPPAHAYSAVYRHIGGCEIPVVVRYNVGGGR